MPPSSVRSLLLRFLRRVYTFGGIRDGRLPSLTTSSLNSMSVSELRGLRLGHPPSRLSPRLRWNPSAGSLRRARHPRQNPLPWWLHRPRHVLRAERLFDHIIAARGVVVDGSCRSTRVLRATGAPLATRALD